MTRLAALVIVLVDWWSRTVRKKTKATLREDN